MRLLSWKPPLRGEIFTAIVLAVVAVCSTNAQQQFVAESTLRPQTLRADSTLVLVPVTVVNRRGAIVNGLGKESFSVTEDGVRQQIRSFSESDEPVSMGVVLDLSASMAGVLETAKESLRALLDDTNPDDEMFLNTVSTRPSLGSGFTRDLGGILQRVALETARGDTALIDTIYASLHQLRTGVHGRKALLIVSDGMDNHSRYSKQELVEYAVEADAQIYSIVVDNSALPAKPMALMEEKRGVLLMDELADRTGGLSFKVRSRTDIARAAASIGRALRNQYTLGYAPVAKSRSGKWRRIRVKVEESGLRAYARTEYRFD
jgi:Ca-activated chloride channel family protein